MLEVKGQTAEWTFKIQPIDTARAGAAGRCSERRCSEKRKKSSASKTVNHVFIKQLK